MQHTNGPPSEKGMPHFLTLPREKLLLIKHKHWITLVIPFLIQGWIGLTIIGILYLVLVFFFHQLLLFFLSSMTVFLFFFTLMAKTYVDWYFHFYIVTNRKIIEYCCTPLFSHSINEVLLDYVRCTEIDVSTDGLVNHLINKGDVTITFDRPTHEEELIFSDIHDPRELGEKLAAAFDMYKTDSSKEGLWFHSKAGPKKYYFTDDLSHNTQGGLL